jgi:hypothetical protein
MPPARELYDVRAIPDFGWDGRKPSCLVGSGRSR